METHIETRCIHSGFEHPYGALTTPIYQVATFAHPGVGQSTGYDYSRVSNPTRTELEAVMTDLEEAKDCVACTTGMAALSLCMALIEPGSHIICSEDLYGGSVRMFKELESRQSLTFSYVNTADPDAVTEAVTPQTKALFIETPSNPTMVVTDLAAMRKIADRFHLLLIVDNTFLSPYYMKPARFGADLILHSGTKYLGGHHDTLAGFLLTTREDLIEPIRYHYKTNGYCLSPFDSFLILRGIKTLAVRMDRQQENALKVAAWLKEQKKVTHVLYVGLPDHPGHDIHNRQASGYGSILSLEVDSRETAVLLLERLHIIAYAESLGGVDSLMTYPMLQTHADVAPEVRERLGITDRFLRLSVGLEHVDDLICDLAQALEDA